MVLHTFEIIFCGLSWLVVTIVDMLLGGIIGFIAGGIIGVVLALFLKLFSWGRFPKKIVKFAMVIAIAVAIVYAIAGIFELLPGHLPK